MHIVIGFLTALVAIFYLLDQLGIDFRFNPFCWRRRRAWNKRYQADAIYSVDDPMHVAAIMILGAAKLNGDLSAEQQAYIKKVRSQFVPPEKGEGTWVQ